MRPPVAAVLFDYGDTLVTYSRAAAEPPLRQAYATIRVRLQSALGVELPAADWLLERISAQVDRGIARDYESGTLQEVDIAATYAACFAAIGLTVPPDLLDWVMETEQRAWFDAVVTGPSVRGTLHRLRAAGLRLGVVSNAAYLPRLMRRQLGHVELLSYLAGTSWSSEVGRRKPDPAIYHDALGKLRVEPEETLFVGDRVREDILGPQAVGMRAVLTHEFRQEPDPQHAADRVIVRLDALMDYLGVQAA